MRIYKCVVSGDEVLCDNDRPLEELDDVVYTVKGKYVEKKNDDGGIAANVDEDAEEGAVAEGTESTKVMVIDVVDQNRLQETSFDKKSYMAYIKGYMKTLKDRLETENPERVEAFQANAQTFLKKMIAKFSDLQFFVGESGNYEGIVILALWEDSGEEATFYYWKDGLHGEKV